MEFLLELTVSKLEIILSGYLNAIQTDTSEMNAVFSNTIYIHLLYLFHQIKNFHLPST